ncbi:unnamed protein product [Rotaria sordida]|uniref:Uncharacterized protein n=1 Tax=Rotaria sordida TaxID=392033 RepID=A0A819SZK0_9BILA|nr:unnamed protein product [Rotaria sordida]
MFALVLNTKKVELSKLKHQLESYRNEHPITGNDNESYDNSQSQNTSPMHTTTTLDDIEYSGNKRTRHQINNTDTSEDDEIQHIEMSNRPSKLKMVDNSQDSSLDLGNDQMDYKTSTINKHYQRRNYVTGVNSISTRPFVKYENIFLVL